MREKCDTCGHRCSVTYGGGIHILCPKCGKEVPVDDVRGYEEDQE